MSSVTNGKHVTSCPTGVLRVAGNRVPGFGLRVQTVIRDVRPATVIRFITRNPQPASRISQLRSLFHSLTRNLHRATRNIVLGLILSLLPMFITSTAFSQQFTAKNLGDYGNVTVMEVTGNYDAKNADGSLNTLSRQVITKEFLKTHKDEYDFIVIFTNFDFQMIDKEAKAFYSGVKNDVQGIGVDIVDNTQLYGSSGKLQGTVDMGNLSKIATNPMDPLFEETLSTLSHEIMHRWGMKAKFKDANGAISSALLGQDGSHWSFLLDSGASLMYGNTWQDNKNGTFTTTTPQGQMKFYSPLDLYLMGMIDKSKVPPMLLITNPDADPTQLPQTGVTITGTGQYITIDQIIAAMGQRIPNASSSQKNYKTAFIYITQPNTFNAADIYGIENIRNGAVTRFSILTDGQALMQIASTLKDDVPHNPGPLPPTTTPRTLPPNINDGVTWLVTNQKTDGSWIDLSQTKERDTAAATVTLKNFSTSQTNYQSGLLWLGTVASGNRDFLSRKIEAMASAGQDTTSLINEIIACQNNDGSWGSENTYTGNALDTALALKALTVALQAGQAGSERQQVIGAAIQYLKTAQRQDGGWGSDDKGSSIQATGNVISILNRYQQSAPSYQLGDSITRGTAWLVARQNPDGGFGNSPSTIYDTAVAAMTLQELNASTDITNRSVTYLLNQQSNDGSWNASAYQTALAVSTVYKSTIDPDLSIKPENITIIPSTIKTLPANIVINADIWNLGQTAAQAKVVLYDGDPSQGKKLGEQTLVFAGQSSTTVTFSTTVKDGSEYQFVIVIDPENSVKESNKLNNSAVRVLSTEATYDFEVSDVVVSINPANILQDVKITSKITNKGTSNAYNVQLRYYIDDAAPFDIATLTVDIPSGATITHEITWRANKAGTNMQLAAMVDPFNNFSEISESNNKASTTITVNPDTRPNLSISYKDIIITPNPSNERGTSTISAAVKNEGFSGANNVLVNFYRGVPGQDGQVIGSSIIPSLASGESTTVTISWSNIQENGEKIIFVKADPDNQINEIRKDDNDAFTTLKILSLPDFALTPNAITFSPGAPKEADPVAITVVVQNQGQQPASNVSVRIAEGSTVLGNLTIPALAGGATGTVSLSYDTAGKKGSHTISATIDPDNQITELNKNNNFASNTFGVQDSNLWIAEPYFSPNGDGIKDSTQFFFRLDTPQTVTVNVINKKNEVVRTFNGPELQNTSAGNVTWDGLNNDGVLAPDGQYQLQVMGTNNREIENITVVVDNNRSSLIEALGTKYLLNKNITCFMPDIGDWNWFSDESGLLVNVNWNNPNVPEYPLGFYTMSPEGEDIQKAIPFEADSSNSTRELINSPDGTKIAFVLNKRNEGIDQLWVMNRDGSNLVFIENTADLGSGWIIYNIHWSPNSEYIFYVKGQSIRITKNDGSNKRILDNFGNNWVETVKWSSNNSQIAYELETENKVRVCDLSGGKKDVFFSSQDGVAWQGFEWLNNNKLILSERLWSGSRLWLIDTSNQGKNIALTQDNEVFSGDFFLSPDLKSVTFITHDGDDKYLKLADDNGNVTIINEMKVNDDSCVSQVSNVIWHSQGENIAFFQKFEPHFYGDGGPSDTCLRPPSSQVVIINVKKNTKRFFAIPLFMTLAGWISDTSLIGYTSNWDGDAYVINPETGEYKIIISHATFSEEDTISPLENHITYSKQVDPTDVCYTSGSSDIWIISSLFNLTADLWIVKDKSTLILKGIAQDRYFQEYKIEYADINHPDVWYLVNPPSNIPVVNDVLATWIPPYMGTFDIKLTVLDKAGNSKQKKKRVSWNTSSSISHIYKTEDFISPNGDGIKDTVELHYKVNTPAHLEFNIYDAEGKTLKTFLKEYSNPQVEDYIIWDGRDEYGKTVTDGKYSIKVFDFEFKVQVDNSPPDINLHIKPMEVGEENIPPFPACIDKDNYDRSCKMVVVAELAGHAFDKNFKKWSIEYGEGENPLEWFNYKRDFFDLKIDEWSMLIANDEDGFHPIQDIILSSFPQGNIPSFKMNMESPIPFMSCEKIKVKRIEWLIGKKLRITAEDFAGNKNTITSNFLEEKIILHSWDGKSLVYKPNTLPSEFVSGNVGIHVIKGLNTIRVPLLNVKFQYQIFDSSSDSKWITAETINNPVTRELNFTWNNSIIGNNIFAIRIKATDFTGKEYYSNTLNATSFDSGKLIIDVECEKDFPNSINILGANLYENLTSLWFEAISDDDRDFKEWTKIEFFESWRNKDDLKPLNEVRNRLKFFPSNRLTIPFMELFMIQLPEDQFKTGKSYRIRIAGLSLIGKEEHSNEETYPPQCPVALSLKVDYKEAQNCGQLSNKAEISAQIMKTGVYRPVKMQSISFKLKSADQSIQLHESKDIGSMWENSNEPKNIKINFPIDTSDMLEKQYELITTLKYYDEFEKRDRSIIRSVSFIVDHTLPITKVTYPIQSQLICPKYREIGWYADDNGMPVTIKWIGVPIEGLIQDNTFVKLYKMYYGFGDKPDEWLPAMTVKRGDPRKNIVLENGQIVPNILVLPFEGSGNRNGDIEAWKIPDLQDGVVPFSNLLRVVDLTGNVSCYQTNYSIDKGVEIKDLTRDKYIFSPNDDSAYDNVNVNYLINEVSIIDIKVFKLKQIGIEYALDSTPIRTIASGITHTGGIGLAIWDGKNDAGVVLPDGKYGIAVFVKESCGNTNMKWVAVEIDNTPPTASIMYPKPGDSLANIVEVKGTATDLHFKNYTLEAGQGGNPETWVPVETKTTAVQNNILGTWNTFNLIGVWTLRLTAYDTVGNKNVTTSTIDLGTRKTLIKDLSAAPKIFSPNADNRADKTIITYELTDACNVSIEFLDVAGVIKKTYSTTVPSLGVYTYTWDGKDNTGVALPDGPVSVRLTATLVSNPSVTQTESITAVIDTTLPLVDIKQPINNSYLSAADIVVNGTISDLNFSTYTIHNGTVLFDQGNQSRDNYTFGTLSNLAEGDYSLIVKATDQGQNETNKTINFTIDRTPPVVKLDTPKTGQYFGTIVTAGSGTAAGSSQQTGLVNITGSIVEKNLDLFNLRYGLGDVPTQWTDLSTGTTTTAYPSSFAWKVGKNDGIADGVYTLSLYAKDKAGLTGETKVKVIVDNTPPTAAITSLHDGDYVKQAVDVKGTAFDQNLDKYTLDISEGQCASAFKWSTIKTGATSVQDNVLGTWQALPPDGDYCLRLIVLDKVGSSSESKINVKVDTHPPAPPVLSGKVDSKINTDLTWIKNIEPDLAGYNLYRDGQKINTTLLTDIKYLDQNLTEGVYIYTVKAVDLAGWESLASNEVKLKIDLTGPNARISFPKDGTSVSGLIDIKGTAYSSDDFKQYRVFIGQGPAPTTWTTIRTSPVPISYGTLAPWDTLGLTEGQVYSIKLEAEDISGNITTQQVSVTIDNTPPATPFVISGSALVSDVTVTWRANTETDLAGYLLYRNDQLANVSGIVIGNMQPYLLAGTTYLDKTLPDGTFKYYVMAMDQAGNISGQSNTIEVTIDTHPPHAAIVDPINAAKFGTKIMVKAESPDFDIASVQFQYQSIQSSPTTTTDWINLGTPITSATLVTYLDPVALGFVYGDYRLRAVATDKGNKTDPSPGYITVTYTDLTPPSIPLALTALTNAGTVTLTWTANTESDLAGYNVYRDGQKINTQLITSLPPNCSIGGCEFRDENRPDGTYLYTITALDTNQNESKPSNQASAKVYAPVITQPYTPIGLNTLQIQGTKATGGSNVGIFIDGGSGLESRGTATADATGKFNATITLNPGENRITSRATDSLGNISKDAEKVVVVYNDTPSAPTGLVTSVQNSDVHLTWNANPETDILGYNILRDGLKLNKSDTLLLSQATLIASSWPGYPYEPEMAIDSNPATYWMPETGIQIDKPAWWEIDLPSQELISRIELNWGTETNSSGNQTLYAGKDFEIQVWSGYAWITQVKVTANAVKDNAFDFKPSYRTDKIRIYITSSTDINTPSQVRLAEVKITKDNLVPVGAQPAYDDVNLPNKTYSYTATAVDNYGFESPLSSAATATVFIAPPTQAPVLNVAVVSTGLNATWVYTGASVAGYNLYRGTTSGGPYTKINSTALSDLSYLDTNVTIGLTYYYVVTAVDSAGNEGPYSNEASGTPPSSIAPAKPILYFPTRAGIPITVYDPVTDIAGSANPGSIISLSNNGTQYGTVAMQSEDSDLPVSINSDGNAISLSGDGKKLVYTYQNAIWIKNLATESVSKVIQVNNTINWISWSPDNKKIAYTSYDNDSYNRISIYDLESGNNYLLINNSFVNENYPSWSPDGNKIVFVQQWGDSPGIYNKDIISGAITQIIATPEARYPKISPDGKMLACFSERKLILYTFVDGAYEIVSDNTDNWSLEWTPDSTSLLFVSSLSDEGLFVYNVVNKTQTLIPGSEGYPYYIAVTADGRYALFDLWDDVNRKDTVWISDIKTPSQPIHILPDVTSVLHIGTSRTGLINVVGENENGNTIAHLLTRKGTFTFPSMQLTPGENIVTATATDANGNKSDPSDPISITYNTDSLPDVLISTEDVSLYPPYPIAGEYPAINAVVKNVKQKDVQNVDVSMYIWNALGELELLKSETIPTLAAGSSYVVTTTWNSTGKLGDNRLIVVVDSEDKIVESDETNNTAIKDFYVANKAGISMTTSLDAVQYTSKQNANISVITRNTGPVTDTVLTVRIEDANGSPVTTFDSRESTLAYATEKTENFVWNTGSTFSGSYFVHSILKDSSGVLLSDQTVPFTILSDAALDGTIVTNKVAYAPLENITSNYTIKHIGTNYIIPSIQIKISITDVLGTILHTEAKTAANLLPGASIDLSSVWNTGLMLPGDYRAVMEVSFEGGATITRSANFKINTMIVLNGTLTASPAVVALGNAAQLAYTLVNTGNADAIGATARISVIDPDTLAVMQTQDIVIDIQRSGSTSGQVTVNTTGYGLKTYTAALQSVNLTGTKNLANASFTVKDLTPPVVTVLAPALNSVFNSSVIFSSLADDAISGVEKVDYQLDNGLWNILAIADQTLGRYGTTWDPLPADAGSHVVRFRATDKAGNTSAPVSVVFTIQYQTDTTPPVLTVSTLPDGAYTNNPTLNISGTAVDDVALDGVTINGTPIPVNGDGTFSHVLTLVDGPNVIKTIAADIAGNISTDTRTITLDRTAPVVTITSPHDNSITNILETTVTGNIDTAAEVTIKINTSEPVSATMEGLNFSLPTTLVYGQNTIEVTATDKAGNTGTAKRTVIYDNLSPALAVINPSQDIATNKSDLLLKGTVSDLTNIMVTVTYNGMVSNPTVTLGTFEQPLNFVEEKTYAIIVTAKDEAGNTSMVQRNIIYDKTPPLVTLNTVTTPTNVTNQQVSGTMEAGAIVAVTCFTASVGVVSYPTITTWQVIISDMAEGENSIQVTGTDSVENTSNPILATIVLDTQAPDTIVMSGPPVLINLNAAGFVFGSTEIGSTFECKVDQGTFAACGSTTNILNVLDGSHILHVRAIDSAGNIDQTPAVYSWTVDTIPPIAAIAGTPQSPTRTIEALLTISGIDVVSYKYKLDNGSYSGETVVAAPINITNLTNGTHMVSVIGKDSANNWQKEEFATTTSWIVDIEKPVLTLSTLPNGAYTNNTTLNISGKATDNIAVKDVNINGSEVTLQQDSTFSHVVTLATGTNTIVAVATDTAGNTATETRTIILDQTAPVVTITSPADNSITNQSQSTITGNVDKLSVVTIKINGSEPVPAVMAGLDFSLPVTLAYGQNTIEVTATDTAGNKGTAKRTIILDNKNPILAVTNPPQDITTNQAGILLKGTVSDMTDITVTIMHEGNTYTPAVDSGTFQQQLSFTAEKVYPIIVTAVDRAGNTSTVQRNIIYDTTSPVIAIDPVMTPTNSTIQQLSGTNEQGSTVTVTCPTAMIGEVSYPTGTTWKAIIADMTEGMNTVSATAADLAGNDSKPAMATILLDTQAPVTTPSPAAGTFTGGVTVSLSTSETATIYYTTNGTIPTTSSPVYTTPVVLSNTTTLSFFAVDVAGNKEVVKTALYTIGDDITPPVTTLSMGNPKYITPDGTVYGSGTTIFTLLAVDNLSGVAKTEYKIDSGAWKAYAPFTLSVQGKHVISYRSIDNRGNVEAIKTFTVVIDTTSPVTTLKIADRSCSKTVYATTPITLTATDMLSGVLNTEYRIDNGEWTFYTGSFTLAGYQDGDHTISYRSTDNVGNKETEKTKTVTLIRKKTAIAYTGPTLIAQTKSVTLSGVLSTSSGKGIDGKTITFTLTNGSASQLCTGSTNTQGKASCTISTVTIPTGTVTITAQFEGDSLYQPVSITKSGIVYGYAPEGSFVIGDKNATMGTSVTFWGSQWSKKNSMSGGSASNSFKGFANTINPNPPTCKGAWTSDPGNSSSPPDSIPSYMAVIVTSKITKSGSVLSGTIPKIVIVKTDSGYDSNPGHSGTGTIVDVLCGGSSCK